MSKIISFDVSSVSTGWAVLEDGKLKTFGVIQPPSTCNLQEKLYWFKNYIETLFKIHWPEHVISEETYYKNVKTLRTLSQFTGVLNLTCFNELAIEPVFVSPQTVRSNFGLKNKQEVFDYVKSKYKAKFRNIEFEGGNDITDAILQALYWQKVIEENENG